MKIQARQSFEVRCTVDGAPCVRIIDASADKKVRWLTGELERHLREKAVQIEGSARFVVGAQEFFAALKSPGQFNCLVLVTHGEVSTWCDRLCEWLSRRILRRTRATRVLLGGDHAPWLWIGRAEADLQDKLVLLAVCGGMCPDTVWSFVREEHLALMMIGSDRSVSGAEVLACFPPVLEALVQAAAKKNEFSPEDVRSALGTAGPTPFRLYSAV